MSGISSHSISTAFNDVAEDFGCRQHSSSSTGSVEGEEEPFIDLSKREIKRPLYRSLARKKQRGTLGGFKSLSDGDLYALFVLEGYTDREVAELFDINRSQVSSKRRRAGTTLEERALVQTLCKLKLLQGRRPQPLVGAIRIGTGDNPADKLMLLPTTLTSCDLAPTNSNEGKAANNAKMAMGFTPTQ